MLYSRSFQPRPPCIASRRHDWPALPQTPALEEAYSQEDNEEVQNRIAADLAEIDARALDAAA
jgi:hypothetical protein